MHTSGCTKVPILILRIKILLYLNILFLIIHADDTLFLNDNTKTFKTMFNVFDDYCNK